MAPLTTAQDRWQGVYRRTVVLRLYISRVESAFFVNPMQRPAVALKCQCTAPNSQPPFGLQSAISDRSTLNMETSKVAKVKLLFSLFTRRSANKLEKSRIKATVRGFQPSTSEKTLRDASLKIETMGKQRTILPQATLGASRHVYLFQQLKPTCR